MNEDTIVELEGTAMHPQTKVIAIAYQQVIDEVVNLTPDRTEEIVAAVLIAMKRLNLWGLQ